MNIFGLYLFSFDDDVKVQYYLIWLLTKYKLIKRKTKKKSKVKNKWMNYLFVCMDNIFFSVKKQTVTEENEEENSQNYCKLCSYRKLGWIN